jgi:hypothetical protein
MLEESKIRNYKIQNIFLNRVNCNCYAISTFFVSSQDPEILQ